MNLSKFFRASAFTIGALVAINFALRWSATSTASTQQKAVPLAAVVASHQGVLGRVMPSAEPHTSSQHSNNETVHTKRQLNENLSSDGSQLSPVETSNPSAPSPDEVKQDIPLIPQENPYAMDQARVMRDFFGTNTPLSSAELASEHSRQMASYLATTISLPAAPSSDSAPEGNAVHENVYDSLRAAAADTFPNPAAPQLVKNALDVYHNDLQQNYLATVHHMQGTANSE